MATASRPYVFCVLLIILGGNAYSGPRASQRSADRFSGKGVFSKGEWSRGVFEGQGPDFQPFSIGSSARIVRMKSDSGYETVCPRPIKKGQSAPGVYSG